MHRLYEVSGVPHKNIDNISFVFNLLYNLASANFLNWLFGG